MSDYSSQIPKFIGTSMGVDFIHTIETYPESDYPMSSPLFRRSLASAGHRGVQTTQHGVPSNAVVCLKGQSPPSVTVAKQEFARRIYKHKALVVLGEFTRGAVTAIIARNIVPFGQKIHIAKLHVVLTY